MIIRKGYLKNVFFTAFHSIGHSLCKTSPNATCFKFIYTMISIFSCGFYFRPMKLISRLYKLVCKYSSKKNNKMDFL